MNKSWFFRLVSLGSVGLLILLTVFMTGPAYLAAEDALAVGLDEENYCAFLPIAMSETGLGGAGGGELPDCPLPASELVDFNGDGFGDLAVGIPNDDASDLTPNSGAVNVLYGTGSGLSAIGSQLWRQSKLGGTSLADEKFGTAVSPGDFNGDGYSDLAVGSPGEDYDGTNAIGQVDIIFGSPSGLTSANAQVLSQADPAVDGAPEEDDQFGQTLESGDFNGDGYSDLAVGIPYEDYEPGNVENMGAVSIFYGSDNGLRTDNDLIIHPALASVSGTPAEDGNFGLALAAGDFNNDDHDDLAVGIPGYDLNMVDGAGAVEVFSGSAGGLSLANETLWRQGFNGIQGNPEDGDGFGRSLATGDFDKNGASDLVVGVPMEDVTVNAVDYSNAGAVQIIYGFALTDGLSGSGDQIWHQGLNEILGDAESGDSFGFALASRDFNGDGADDLAVGIPGEANDFALQGQVIAFYSNGSILSFDNQDLFMQGIIEGAPEAGDYLGYSLGTADFDGNGIADLAIGSPFEDVPFGGAPQIVDAGAVNVVYGQETGLGVSGNQIWGRHISGIEGDPQTLDLYGFALSQ
jgi:hypothetical protein